jgi:ParB family chromosome partitioning protein
MWRRTPTRKWPRTSSATRCPIEIARFIKGRIDAGESNVTIAKRIGMNLTSVAHHLTLFELPPELGQAMQAGR